MLSAVLSFKTDKIVEERSSDSLISLQAQESVTSANVTDEMEVIFISALYSSLGAPLEGNSRLVFDEFLKKITGFTKIDDSPKKRATFSKSNIFLYLYTN